MAIKNLNDLFKHTLQDIYFAENYITKSLPKMVESANDEALAQAFDSHLEETREHVARLEEAFRLLGEEPSGEECPAIEGIVGEAEELLEETEDADTRDAALIAAAQAVEHYEITRYGSAISWAKELGHDEVANLLVTTLEEEKNADAKLLDLGKARLNRKAA